MQNKYSKEALENFKFVVGKAVHSGNNHLSTIITSCDLLMNQYTGEVQHKANVIKNRCKLMAEQMKSLRQFATLGDADMFMSNSVSAICEKMFHQHMNTVKPDSLIQFKNKIPESIKMHSGVQMTETLFGEIIKNAIQSLADSSDDNKTIVASAEQLSDRLVIQISDSGPAMDDDIRDYMFNPFYSSRKTEPGMGLSLVKQILLLMNGHIFFERKDNFNIFRIEFSNTTGNI